MPYKQIRRPVGTSSGLQDGSDGGRLVEMYASAAIIPEESTVSVILRGAPGISDGYNAVPDLSVKNIMRIDSPVYGDHLFVFTNTHFYVYSGVTNGELSAANLFASHAFPAGYNLNIADDRLLRWADDGRHLVFITEDEVYAIDREAIQEHHDGDQTNSVFVDITAPVPDDESDATDTEAWVDIVYADGYFVLASKGGQIFHSELGTLTFAQLDFSRADVKPDAIVAMAFFQNQLFIFGSESIERWQNKGLADFAFQRDTSSSFDIGCYSRETLVQNEVSMHFLGSDLSYYSLVGNRLTKISNDVVDRVIRQSIENDGSHAFPAFVYTEEGHKFVGLHMGVHEGDSDHYTWTFDWVTRQWHERYSSAARFITSAVRWQDTNYIALAGERRVRNMRLGLKKNIVHDDGRRYVSMPIIQVDQMRLRHFSLQFDVHYKGPAEDVITLVLEWSDNNQVTWKGGRQKKWQRGIRTKFNQLGQVGSQGRHYRLRIDGATGEVAVFGAYIHAEVLAN